MSTGVRLDPYPGFRFHVEIDGLIVGGFSEVEGLQVELETETYEEGGENGFTHELPTRVSHSNLTFRRGVTDMGELWNWMNQGMNGPPERKTGMILIFGTTGQAVRGWQFRNGYPVRWSGPDLDAQQGAVAIEELEIAHEGLEQIGLGP